jgi:hypothetical protein
MVPRILELVGAFGRSGALARFSGPDFRLSTYARGGAAMCGDVMSETFS